MLIPTKNPGWFIQSAGKESSLCSVLDQVRKTVWLVILVEPFVFDSFVINLSRCILSFIFFSHKVRTASLVNHLSCALLLLITRPHRMVQMRCADSVIMIRYRRVLPGNGFVRSLLKFIAVEPNISPRVGWNHSIFFFSSVCFARVQISDLPGMVHSVSMCDMDSSVWQCWQMARSS